MWIQISYKSIEDHHNIQCINLSCTLWFIYCTKSESLLRFSKTGTKWNWMVAAVAKPELTPCAKTSDVPEFQDDLQENYKTHLVPASLNELFSYNWLSELICFLLVLILRILTTTKKASQHPQESVKGYLLPGGLAETARQLGREALAEVAGFLHHCGRGAWLGWRWRLMEMAKKKMLWK